MYALFLLYICKRYNIISGVLSKYKLFYNGVHCMNMTSTGNRTFGLRAWLHRRVGRITGRKTILTPQHLESVWVLVHMHVIQNPRYTATLKNTRAYAFHNSDIKPCKHFLAKTTYICTFRHITGVLYWTKWRQNTSLLVFTVSRKWRHSNICGRHKRLWFRKKAHFLFSEDNS